MKYSKSIILYSKKLTKYINKRENKNITKKGRPNKFPINFYVRNILNVIINGTCWNKLNLFDNITGKLLITGDAIRKKFEKWKKIFIDFHTNFYNYYINNYKNKINDKFFNVMYLDSTTILNANNSTLTSYSYKYKNKKSIKLSAICDDNKIFHSVHFSKSNIFDNNLIVEPFKKLKIKPIKLVADLGYLVNKSTLNNFKRKNINLITDKRKNMKCKISKKNKKLIKKRIKIEHAFSLLKRGFRRFQNIYDRKLSTLNVMFYIANAYLMFKKLNS